jgi:probable phosphoglycerate mutase
MTAVVYLIRHATPDWSRTDIRYDIPPGPPLTAQGEVEAARLGEFLQTAGVQKVYASPLERAKRTAQLAALPLNLAVEEVTALAEWRRGESEAELLARMLPFWEGAHAESYQVGPIALVSHGGPIRLLLQQLNMAQAEIDFYRKQFDRDNPVPPAGAWRIAREHGNAPWQTQLAFTPQPHTVYTAPLVYV